MKRVIKKIVSIIILSSLVLTSEGSFIYASIDIKGNELEEIINIDDLGDSYIPDEYFDKLFEEEDKKVNEENIDETPKDEENENNDEALTENDIELENEEEHNEIDLLATNSDIELEDENEIINNKNKEEQVEILATNSDINETDNNEYFEKVSSDSQIDKNIEEENKNNENKLVISTDSEANVSYYVIEEFRKATNSEINSKLYNDIKLIDENAALYEEGKVKLAKDITINKSIEIVEEEILDLNGYNIKANNSYAISVYNTNFTIEDNSDKNSQSEIISNYIGGTLFVSGGTLNLNSGNIKNSSYESEQTVFVENANININGSNIYGTKGKDSHKGIGGNGTTAIKIVWNNDDYKFVLNDGFIKGGNGGDGIVKDEFAIGVPAPGGLINNNIINVEENVTGFRGGEGGGKGGLALCFEIDNVENISQKIVFNKINFIGGNGGHGINDKKSIKLFSGNEATLSSYNSYDENIVKRTANQGASGLCMTFAYASCAEAYLSKFYPEYVKELGYEEGKLDLSEAAFACSLAYGINDPFSNAARGERKINPPGSGGWYGMYAGSTINEVESNLSKWNGFIEDKHAKFEIAPNNAVVGVDGYNPYSDDILNKDKNVALFKSSYAYADALIRNDDNVLEKEEEEKYLELMKQAIVKHGAIFVGCKIADYIERTPFKERCDKVKAANPSRASVIEEYYDKYKHINSLITTTQEYKGGGHGITIIGWDDNFPKEYFNTEGKVEDPYGNEESFTPMQADRDGAALVRNSWEVDTFEWVSYDFLFAFSGLQGTEFAPATEYDNFYYYDSVNNLLWDYDMGRPQTVRYDYLANIFKNNNGNQELKGVMYDMTYCSSFILQVYKVEDNSAEALDKALADSSLLLYEKEYQKPKSINWAFIEIDDKIIIEDNTYFAIVLKRISQGLTATYDYSRTLDYGQYIQSYETTNAGASYVRKNDENKFQTIQDGCRGIHMWGGTTPVEPGNLVIKAITNNTESFTVSFDTGGGSEISAKRVVPNTTMQKPADPTKKGCSFVGWYKDEDCNEPWIFESDIVTGDMTLYAKWDVGFYQVTFESNGGTEIESSEVEYEQLVSEPSQPERKGYDFDAWYKDKDFKSKWDFYSDTMPGENITLYAKWIIKSYTVSFDTGDATSIPEQTIKFNEKVKKPTTDPEKEGHTFINWYKDSSFNELWDFDKDVIEDNTIIYAKMVADEDLKKYTVTFKTNGGNEIPSIEVIEGKFIDGVKNPTKEGYTFEGWYKDSTLSQKFSLTGDAIRKNITLYANWEINKYKVTFDTACAYKINPIEVEYGKTVKEPDTPVRGGYRFISWNLNGSTYNFSTPVKKNITLVAKWQYTMSSGGSSSGGSSGSGGSSSYSSYGSSGSSGRTSDGRFIGPLASQLNAQLDAAAKNNNLLNLQKTQNNTNKTMSKNADGHTICSAPLKNVNIAGLPSWSKDPFTGKWKVKVNTGFSNFDVAGGLFDDITSGARYCIDENGEMVTGWVKNGDGFWYYFDETKNNNEGKLRNGEITIGNITYVTNQWGMLMINQDIPNTPYKTDSEGRKVFK